MNKNTELKRCPFCGGEPTVGKDWFGLTFIECTNCEIELAHKEPSEVAKAWNTRPGEDKAYEAGLQQGAAQALSRNAGLSEWQRVECIGKGIQANQTGTGGPKIY